MDLQAPCNIFCTTNYRSPSIFRLCSPSRKAINYAKTSTKCRRSMTSSELQGSPEVPRSPRISVSSSAPSHKVTVHDRQRDVVHEFYVPEDQYILHTAEAQNISLPFACRHGDVKIEAPNGEIVIRELFMAVCPSIWPVYISPSITYGLVTPNITKVIPVSSWVPFASIWCPNIGLSTPGSTQYQCCCTSCAVRIKSGQLRQPEALGISAELKAKGYALLCVGFPTSDIEVETQDEDEVYWLQFGRYFARGPIERDDYALELAMGDE